MACMKHLHHNKHGVSKGLCWLLMSVFQPMILRIIYSRVLCTVYSRRQSLTGPQPQQAPNCPIELLVTIFTNQKSEQRFPRLA